MTGSALLVLASVAKSLPAFTSAIYALACFSAAAHWAAVGLALGLEPAGNALTVIIDSCTWSGRVVRLATSLSMASSDTEIPIAALSARMNAPVVNESLAVGSSDCRV